MAPGRCHRRAGARRDELPEPAHRFVRRAGGREPDRGHDGQGFLDSLRTVADPASRSLVVLGAGGAARAIAVETALAGAGPITIVDRDERRGGELARLLRERCGADAGFVAWTGANPPRTQLIREAEARGCTVLDGLGTLVAQGAIAIAHWTGIEPDREVMRAALERVLASG